MFCRTIASCFSLQLNSPLQNVNPYSIRVFMFLSFAKLTLPPSPVINSWITIASRQSSRMKLLPKKGWPKKKSLQIKVKKYLGETNWKDLFTSPISDLFLGHVKRGFLFAEKRGGEGGRHMSVNWALVLCNMVGVRELLLKKLLKSSLKFVTKSPKF